MRAFKDINPFVLFIYFISISCFPAFYDDGILYAISFTGALINFLFKNSIKEHKTHIFYLTLFIVLSIINPIFSHNGKTVLFVINNSPITLESFIYGVFYSLFIISVLYWFKLFSQIMSSDKILYIFDRFSPKLALVISMSLRYIPLFKSQYVKIKQGIKILGDFNDDNIIDEIRINIKSFSTMVTWTLENGIITAESMDARGYGTGIRSRYSNYSLLLSDILCLIVLFIFFIIAHFYVKSVIFNFYPIFEVKVPMISLVGYISYLTIVMIPIFIDTKENIKWTLLRQKV